MTAFQFYTVDVFTSKRFGGNQLAVFTDAAKIPEAAMPLIAREFNFSETTFVLPPANPAHTRRVRIFTPGAELPFAGHPTVGTAFVLASVGAFPLTGAETRIILEEGVGPVPVTVRAADGVPGFAQLSAAQLPQSTPAPSRGDIAACIGLDPDDIMDGTWGPEIVSCGVPFLFASVRDRRTIARARPIAAEFERRDFAPASGVFVFCADPELPGSHYRARMFAPLIGVPEDPATGSACAAFGGYLARRDARRDGTLRWTVEQGFEMGRPSLIEVETDKAGDAVTAVRVGGHSVMVTKGEFTL